jgi:hypothetical protein
VIAHTDTETAGNPVKDYCRDYGRPAPKKKRRDGSEMGDNEKYPRAPIPIGPTDLRPLVKRPGFVTSF